MRYAVGQFAWIHGLAGLMLSGCVVGSAHADGLKTFSVFDSPGLDRQIHGRERAIDLSAGPLRLGDASAFFGVDSLSDDTSHYLSSGLRWKSADTGTPLLSVAAVHTAARGGSIGSQTLMRAETRLKLGQRWYLPSLTFEADQLSASGSAGPAFVGRATRLGFGRDFAAGGYHVGYFQAGSHYTPWGSAVTAGDSGLEFSGALDLGGRWRIDNTVLLHEGGMATGTPYGLVDKWSFSGIDDPDIAGRPWRLSAQFGRVDAIDAANTTPLSLELASRTRSWRDWHIDSALGWYQGDVGTPGAVPVAGGLWQISARRDLDLAGLQTRFQPSFSIGGSQQNGQALGSRTGLAMGFPGLLDSVALSVDYLSAGWGPVNDRPDMRMTLNVTQNAGAVLPRLGSLVDRLRGHWFGWE